MLFIPQTNPSNMPKLPYFDVFHQNMQWMPYNFLLHMLHTHQVLRLPAQLNRKEWKIYRSRLKHNQHQLSHWFIWSSFKIKWNKIMVSPKNNLDLISIYFCHPWNNELNYSDSKCSLVYFSAEKSWINKRALKTHEHFETFDLKWFAYWVRIIQVHYGFVFRIIKKIVRLMFHIFCVNTGKYNNKNLHIWRKLFTVSMGKCLWTETKPYSI